MRGEIDVNKLPAGTPVLIRELVRRCLDRDVKTRLRDIGEARIAIQRYRASPSEAGLSERVVTRGIRREVFAWIAAGVLLVALAFVYYRHASEEARTLKLSLLPPEKAAFFGAPAVSPDGRRVTFAATAGERTQLWVRDLDSLAARPLAGTEGAYNRREAPPKCLRVTADGSPVFVASFAGGSLQVPALPESFQRLHG